MPRPSRWCSTRSEVSYEQLVEYFWRTIDPTTKDRQFCDGGSPYRTGIFVHDAQQLAAAQASKAALEKSKPFKEPIVTEISMAGPSSTPPRTTTRTTTRRTRSATSTTATAAAATSACKQIWGSLPTPPGASAAKTP